MPQLRLEQVQLSGRNDLPAVETDDFPPVSVDSHIHAYMMDERGIPADASLGASFEAGTRHMLEAGVGEQSFKPALALKHKYPQLLISAGLHPGTCSRMETEMEGSVPLDKRLQAVAEQVASDECAAVGECGLDYFRSGLEFRDRQIALFKAQIELARELKKPLIVHNREADEDVVELLENAELPAGGILHCYSTGERVAEKLVPCGFLVSFAGNLTYKNSKKIRRTAAALPAEKILVESDAPFLPPQPVRGETNRPAFTAHTVSAVAALRRVPFDEINRTVLENFRSLFGL